MPENQLPKLVGFEVGQRVELHPATDLWMRGARYGKVVKVGRKLLHVELDYRSQVVRVSPNNIYRIVSC